MEERSSFCAYFGHIIEHSVPQFPNLLKSILTVIIWFTSGITMDRDHEVQHQNKTMMDQIAGLLQINLG